ncbi:MAG: PIN domain-containing protein, partial [Peptostreptococcaceae bacterium]
LFLTNRTEKHFSDTKINEIVKRAKVQRIHVITGTKNSLDFQLVSFLGFLIGEHKIQNLINEYYIVSKDQGFWSSINLLNNCSDNKVDLVSSINEVKNQHIELDLLTTKTFESLYAAGYRVKTVNKMLGIILSSQSIIEVKDKFLFTFGNSPAIFNNCEAIINNYFKSRNYNAA